jgi:hypothetical protein
MMRRMRRAIVALPILVMVASCGGGHKSSPHKETAHDVEVRLMRVHTGLLPNPRRVICKRGSAKFWDCEVTLGGPPSSSDGLTTEVQAEVQVRAR